MCFHLSFFVIYHLTFWKLISELPPLTESWEISPFFHYWDDFSYTREKAEKWWSDINSCLLPLTSVVRILIIDVMHE